MKTKALMEAEKPSRNPPANAARPLREPAPVDGLATKREASTFLRVCMKTIDRLIARIQLSKKKLGRATRIPWTALHRGRDGASLGKSHSDTPVSADHVKVSIEMRPARMAGIVSIVTSR